MQEGQVESFVPEVVLGISLEEDLDLLNSIVELVSLHRVANGLDLSLDGRHAGKRLLWRAIDALSR